MKCDPANKDACQPPVIVRDLMILAPEGVHSEGTVKEALDDMVSEGVVSSPVTDVDAQFVGTVSESELNRKVSGRGHDPAKEPLDQQMDTLSAYCFEDDTIDTAQQKMEEKNLKQLPVLSREFTLLGTITIEMIRAAATKAL